MDLLKHQLRDSQTRLKILAFAVLMMLPVSTALRGYFLSIPALHLDGHRIFLVVGVVIAAVGRSVYLYTGKMTRQFTLLAFLWVTWGLISCFWAPELSSALSEILAVGLGLLLGYLVYNLGRITPNSIEALSAGWLLAFVVTSLIAVWELASGHHLAGDFVSNAPHSVVSGVIVSTFENPNNYGAFLVLCVSFLYWFYLRTSGYKKVAFILLGIGLLLLLLKTHSRGALIAFVIQILLILVMNQRRIRNRMVKVTVAVAVIFSVIGAVVLEPSIFHKMLSLYTELAHFGSASERLNLYANGLQFTWDSHFLGIGPGAFEFYMQNGYGILPTGHDIDPHNFWIQILSQYGVFVFVPFVWWLIRCARVGVTARQAAIAEGTKKMIAATECLLVGLIGYPLAAVEHSSYIKEPTNWMFLASVLLFSAYIAKELRTKVDET